MGVLPGEGNRDATPEDLPLRTGHRRFDKDRISDVGPLALTENNCLAAAITIQFVDHIIAFGVAPDDV